MKKIIFVAVFATASLVVLSCEVDGPKEFDLQTNESKAVDDYPYVQKSDSIPPNNGETSSEGPGDEVFPVKPPKKTN